MLRNPFYAGLLPWNGQTYQGAHKPMVTIAELRRAEQLLTRPGKPIPKARCFPFTVLIRFCECGYMVTAEEKINKYVSHYTYYHCSKRRLDYDCRQRSIDAPTLNAIFEPHLRQLVLSPKLNDWAQHYIKSAARDQESEKALQLRTLEKAHQQTQRARSNLVNLRIREAIDEAEFARQRQALEEEGHALQERLRSCRQGQQWFELANLAISFGNRAIFWFREGDHQKKRQILRIVGSNFSLTDKKLSFQANKPFSSFSKNGSCSALRAAVEEVRTLSALADPKFMETIASLQDLMRAHDLRPASIPAVA
jgi:hypothetical protein